MKTAPLNLGPRDKRLFQADAMPSDLKVCVHEYGLPIVLACIKAGVDQPPRIHELVREIWAGAREHSQRRQSPSSILEWYFLQAGVDINTDTLLRLLKNQNLIICPDMATREMIDASMATVSGYNVITTKREKHTLRLNAAMAVAAKYLSRMSRTSALSPHRGETP